MLSTRSLLLSLVLVLASASPAASLSLDVSGGQLFGAFGVDVAGDPYNVEFIDSSCVAIFGDCDAPTDFAFTTFNEAKAATQALFDQVLVDGIAGSFDSQPALTNGCESPLQCLVITCRIRRGQRDSGWMAANDMVAVFHQAKAVIHLPAP